MIVQVDGATSVAGIALPGVGAYIVLQKGKRLKIVTITLDTRPTGVTAHACACGRLWLVIVPKGYVKYFIRCQALKLRTTARQTLR